MVPDSIFCETSAGGLELLKECGYPITCALDFINNYISQYGEYLVISQIPTKMNYAPSKEVLALEESATETQESVVEAQESVREPLNKEIPEDMDTVAIEVYNLLKNDKLSADIISRTLNLPIGVVLSTLSFLEIDNFIRSLGGNIYTAQD